MSNSHESKRSLVYEKLVVTERLEGEYITEDVEGAAFFVLTEVNPNIPEGTLQVVRQSLRTGELLTATEMNKQQQVCWQILDCHNCLGHVSLHRVSPSAFAAVRDICQSGPVQEAVIDALLYGRSSRGRTGPNTSTTASLLIRLIQSVPVL